MIPTLHWAQFGRGDVVATSVSGVWDPGISMGAALSGGGRTATFSYSGGTHSIAQSAIDHSSGKHYCEIVFVSGSKFGTDIPPLFSFNKEVSLIGNAQSPTAYVLKGALNTSGSALAEVMAGDTVMMAIDIDAAKVWFGVNGTWHSSGNPAAGTGETASGIAAGSYRVKAVGYNTNSMVATANFTAPQMSYGIPSGFSAWG